MTPPILPATWIAFVYRLAVSHVRDGLPNQDAFAKWSAPEGAPPLASMAIADGHGSPRHFRSATGARFAVVVTIAALRDLAAALDAANDAERAHLASVELPQRIVASWTERARDHFAQTPFSDEEQRGVEAGEGAAALEAVRADPLLAYGATLLAALVTERCIVLTQLGNGDLLAVAGDGATTRPVPADERLSGNLTTSLCRAGAESDFRSIVLRADSASAPSLLVLSTDGYANSFKSDADFLQVGRDFLQMIASDGLAAVEGQLAHILDDASTNGSGDDITLGLLKRAGGPQDGMHRTIPDVSDFESRERLVQRLLAAERRTGTLKLALGGALLVAAGSLAWIAKDHIGSPATQDGSASGSASGLASETRPRPGVPSGRPEIVKPPRDAQKPELDGAIVASTAVAAKIEALRSSKAADGIKVDATIAFSGTVPAGCKFEATVFDAKDQKLESATAVVAIGDEGKTGMPVELTVPYAKADKDAKAMKAKDAKVSSLLSCEGITVAETKRQRIGA